MKKTPKNPKKVSVGDIMQFYPTYSKFSTGCWTDDNNRRIPYNTCGIVVNFFWTDEPEYAGYMLDLQLPDGYITEGWGEYAVYPICKKNRTGKIWYRGRNFVVRDVEPVLFFKWEDNE